jgi:hypothetical protein
VEIFLQLNCRIEIHHHGFEKDGGLLLQDRLTLLTQDWKTTGLILSMLAIAFIIASYVVF